MTTVSLPRSPAWVPPLIEMRRYSPGNVEEITSYFRHPDESTHTLAEGAGVDVRVTVQRGPVAEIILLHARARSADLIVLGSRGRGSEGP